MSSTAPIFKIDASSIQKAFDLSKDDFDSFRNYIVESVASRYVRDIKAMARRDLSRTREEYTRAVSMINPSTGVVIVELNGVLPNMIEQGASPFDQKEGFSRSNKATQKLDGGWYLTIPFSHATPNTTGDFASLGSPMPESVYEEAKELGANEGLSDDGNLPRLNPRPKIIEKTRVYDEYIRKHSPYEGMRKNITKGHSGYVSFRRVSDKSDDNSWIHSGFVARNFFNRAFNEDRLVHEVDVARDMFIRTIL